MGMPAGLCSFIHIFGAAAVMGGAISGAILLTGCTVTAGGFANEADELRFKNGELQDDLTEMTRDRDEWRAKAEERATAIETLNNAEILEALPRVTGIDIDRLSGFFDRDGAPGYEGVDVYVLPKDARDRFVQAVGTMTVSLMQLPAAGSEDPPQILVTRTLSPRELREAYRNTLLSVHYSIQLALDPPLLKRDTDSERELAHEPIPPMQLLVTFYDAITNITHTELKLID